MKYLYILIFFFAFTTAFAQTDTVQLSNGRILTGKVEPVYHDRLIITDSSNHSYLITFDHIKTLSVIYPSKQSNFERANTLDAVKANLKLKNWNTPKRHFELAGEFGITGVSIMVGTTLGMGVLYGLEKLGTIKLSPHQRTAIYSSLGIDCGIGLGLLIPAFMHIKKAGQIPEYIIP